jgi:SAM-dependent methyltransferase
VCLRTTADPRLPGNADRTFTHCTALLKGPAVTSQPQWLTVDEGWGRKAVDFATLSEPANCREYATLHHLLALNSGDRVLDLACGSGLALELAAVRGASCSGIDASGRLVAIAKDRLPHADIRVGDMNQLPWPDASFDVVTSFRGIWVTTPDAVTEAWRVLRLLRAPRHSLTDSATDAVSLRVDSAIERDLDQAASLGTMSFDPGSGHERWGRVGDTHTSEGH